MPTWLRAAMVVALGAVAVAAVPQTAVAAATCQTSGPAGGAYTVSVCIDAPSDGAPLTGDTTVTASATFTGTSPGVQRMVFYLDGQYLLTDYQAPYTFTVPTARFVDGVKSLQVEALLRDTYVTPRTGINVTFTNGVTTPPVNTGSWTPTPGTEPAAGDAFTLAAVGDGAGGDISETQVTNLMAGWNPNLAFYLGDVYEKGTPTEFYNWYRPEAQAGTFYGRFRSITDPTIGNHEYQAGSAPGYFDYWDNIPHYYSVDSHGWHIVSLDTNSAYGQTSPTSAQYQWLAADLAANTQPCTVVMYHQPLFNIGDEGPTSSVADIWSLLAANSVDLVLNGHDHTYQRWTPLDGAGNPSPTGVTELVDGTGGHAIGGFLTSDNRVVASAKEYGALKLSLNSAGAAYQYTTVAGQTLDSGSVQCNPTATDTVKPSTPTDLTAAGSYKTRVDLSWHASTDNVGVTAYEIWRDGAKLDSVSGQTSYADTTVTPGTTHSYQVRAKDAAGNVSALSTAASATTPTIAVLFYDGFESGGLSNWINPAPIVTPTQAGLVADSTQVFAGSWGARSTSTGLGAAAWRATQNPETNLYYVARFKALGHASTVGLMRFRNTASGANAIASVGLTTNNKLTLRNDGAGATAATTTSTVAASAGAWHTVQVHVVVNGASSSSEVWLDGAPVPDLTKTLDLGINPIGRVELGDPNSASPRSYDVAFDEVAFDREYVGDLTAPTAATNLQASPHSGLRVDITWTAGTDDVGISGYDLYRNGALLTSIPAGTSYSDTTVAPLTSYSYKLVSRDAAGNASGFSPTASVTTSDVFIDTFESGGLTNWTSVSGLQAQQSDVDTGTWAARASSDGTSGASAQVSLDSGIGELYYRTRFKVLSSGTNSVGLARFRTAANGALMSAFISSTGKLGYRNDTNGTTRPSTLTVSPGVWHELQMHLRVDGDTSQADVLLDGLPAVSTTDSLGTSPIGRLELGDPSSGRIFNVAFDNVVADPQPVTDAGVPSVPTNLHTTFVAGHEVHLAWDPASDDIGVTTYRVYRDGAPIANVDASTGTTYADTTVADASSYSYTVSALDAVNHESALSQALIVTTPDVTKPTSPSGLTATAVAHTGKIDLSWAVASDNVGVDTYRIYRVPGPAGPIGTVNGADRSYADTTVTSATAYSYTVTAMDAAGNESDPSSPATTTSADVTKPASPSGVTATAVARTAEIDLSWAAASDNVGVDTYRIYRVPGPAGPVGTVNGAVRSFADTTVTSATAYSYTVTAMDAAGNESDPSSPATATSADFRKPTPPGNVAATAASESRIDLTWTAASDDVAVTGYRVYRNGSSTPAATLPATARSYADTGLAAGTTVSYAVRAVDAAGNESDPASASTSSFVFMDGFESGNLSKWTSVTSLVTQQRVVYPGGSWSAEAVSPKNTASFAVKQLPATYSDVYYRARVHIISGDQADLLGLQTASGAKLIYLSYDKKKVLGYTNGITNTSAVSTTTLSTGTWYDLKVHLVINGASSQVEVWLNGTKVTALSKTENLGTAPVAKVILGEDNKGRTFDHAYDEVLVSKQP
jgi:fibronectin type 3 domain-containing protein